MTEPKTKGSVAKANMGKRRRWAFTWNNWTKDSEIRIKKGFDDKAFDFVIYGKEGREDGHTPHLQGYVEFPYPVTLLACAKAINGGDKDHTFFVKACWHNQAHNINYCIKEAKEDWHVVRYGKPKEQKGSQWEEILETIQHLHKMEDIVQAVPGIAIRYFGNVEKINNMYNNIDMNESIKEEFEGKELRPWQGHLEEELKFPSDPRKIIWYFDPKGNKGKSWMGLYLHMIHDALLITGGKDVDVKNLYHGEKTIVFNFSRDREDFLPYGAIEAMKDRTVTNTKYMPELRKGPIPHVICFANYMPNIYKMSLDRWDIREILEDFRIKKISVYKHMDDNKVVHTIEDWSM